MPGHASPESMNFLSAIDDYDRRPIVKPLMVRGMKDEAAYGDDI